MRTTSRSPVLSRRESPLPSQPSNQGGQRNAGRWVKRPQACLTFGLCGCGLRELLTLLKVVKDKTVTPPLHRGASQNREFQKIKTNGRIDRLLRHNIMTAYNVAD